LGSRLRSPIKSPALTSGCSHVPITFTVSMDQLKFDPDIEMIKAKMVLSLEMEKNGSLLCHDYDMRLESAREGKRAGRGWGLEESMNIMVAVSMMVMMAAQGVCSIAYSQ